MTRAQRRALAEWLPVYEIAEQELPLDLPANFGRDVPVIMEIGFGDGAALVQLAAEAPECDFVGVEVYRPGIGRLLLRLKALGLTNVRILCEDAGEVMRQYIAPQSLTKVLIFFPDPWPKKRQQKRRLIQPDFIRVVTQTLKPGGHLHLATDWEEYAEHMLQVLQAEPGLLNTVEQFAERPGYRVPTKYEQRGEALGHKVWDLIFARRG